MERTTLGRSGLEVSRVCFGTWQFGGDWGAIDRGEAKAAVRRALDLGITFFDTAQAYGFGRSESLLAEALGDDIHRDDIVVATKGGLREVPDGIERDSRPEILREGVEESLRHLGVEAIDLYQVHWPDPKVPFETTAAALEELKDEGKIRHVGVSNYSVDQMEQLGIVETLQPPYHLFKRDIEEGVLPWCREHDVGVLAYGPLAHGLLSGRFDRNTRLPEDDWRHTSDVFTGEAFERNLRAVEELRAYAGERGWTLPQLAVGWVLARPGVHVVIVGARRPSHIEGTAALVELTDDDVRAIDRIMEPAAQVVGPTPEG
jgi:aryl-alcohol dehydrogenase-like predicted oxidoreductase